MDYAGDLEPLDAYRLLADDVQAVLVDCRTTAEWSYVGAPDLAEIDKQVSFVEWNRFPDGALNDQFVEELSTAVPDRNVPLLFLCRSGVRSKAAAVAATAAGWAKSFNISDGFEGPTDPDGHRGETAGWKAVGLPWRQP
jgi:rhodanese-related sulfurtransferase